MNIFRVFPYVRKLEAEVVRLDEKLQKALCGEITVESMMVENGGARFELGTRIGHLMAAHMYEVLKDLDAENYVEMQFLAPDDKKLTVTIQRHEGMTPHQLRRKAEKELAEWKQKAEQPQ